MPEEIKEWTIAREARNFLGIDQDRLKELVADGTLRGSYDGDGNLVAIAAVDLPNGIRLLYPQT